MQIICGAKYSQHIDLFIPPTLLHVQNDILSSLNNNQMVALVLLDLSGAFDTIDHRKLLEHLNSRFRIHGTTLNWFRSYLFNRSQAVRINNRTSERRSKLWSTSGVCSGQYCLLCMFLQCQTLQINMEFIICFMQMTLNFILTLTRTLWLKLDFSVLTIVYKALHGLGTPL